MQYAGQLQTQGIIVYSLTLYETVIIVVVKKGFVATELLNFQHGDHIEQTIKNIF